MAARSTPWWMFWRLGRGEWSWGQSTAVALAVFAAMALLARWIDGFAWQIQTTDSMALPASGVLMVAAVVWAATWIWGSYRYAEACVEAGEALTRHIVRFGATVVLALIACVGVSQVMYTQLFTWYAARYEGLTTATLREVAALPHLMSSAGSDGLRISGPIGLGTAHAAEQWLQANRGVKWVELNSQEGLAPEALNLGKVISHHQLDVIVRQSCVGACVWALLGGHRRVVVDDAHVACYKPYMPIFGNAIRATAADKKLMEWGAEQSVDSVMVERCLSQAKWNQLTLDASLLRNSGFSDLP